MAVSRWIFSNLEWNGGGKLASATWRRLITSGASPSYAVEKPRVKTADASSNSNKESLKRSILGLKSPTATATTVLQNWTDSGHTVENSELRLISNILLKSRRYNQAIQVVFFVSHLHKLLIMSHKAKKRFIFFQ